MLPGFMIKSGAPSKVCPNTGTGAALTTEGMAASVTVTLATYCAINPVLAALKAPAPAVPAHSAPPLMTPFSAFAVASASAAPDPSLNL